MLWGTGGTRGDGGDSLFTCCNDAVLDYLKGSPAVHYSSICMRACTYPALFFARALLVCPKNIMRVAELYSLGFVYGCQVRSDALVGNSPCSEKEHYEGRTAIVFGLCLWPPSPLGCGGRQIPMQRKAFQNRLPIPECFDATRGVLNR